MATTNTSDRTGAIVSGRGQGQAAHRRPSRTQGSSRPAPRHLDRSPPGGIVLSALGFRRADLHTARLDVGADSRGSKIDANLQRQNLHQSPSCRILPNAQRPTPAHHLLSRKPGTRSGRRLAGTGAQTPIRCRDKSPCRGLRPKSERGWRKPATKKRAPPDPRETARDRPSPSNPTRSRSNNRGKPVRCTTRSKTARGWLGLILMERRWVIGHYTASPMTTPRESGTI